MEWVQDFFYINKLAIVRSAKALVKNPVLLLLGLLYTTIQLASSVVLARIPLLGGLLMAMVMAVLLSHYFYMLHEILLGMGKCHIRMIGPAVKMYFFKVYGVMFFLYLIQFVLGTFFSGNFTVVMIVLILGFLLLNALPETIYQKYYDAWSSIRYSVDFIKGNYIEWFLPNILFLGLLILLNGFQLGASIFQFMPSGMMSFSWQSVLFYFVQQIVFLFVMLYRGELFHVLTTTSKHRRMYERKMKISE